MGAHKLYTPGEHVRYACGFCEHVVAGDVYEARVGDRTVQHFAICPACYKATNYEWQLSGYKFDPPRPLPGRALEGVPDAIEALHTELRACYSVGAYTAAVMVGRTIMMHVAVANGAKPGTPFQACADHLSKQGFVPANAHPWLTKIRDLGTDGTHALDPVTEDSAKMTLRFVELLLANVYEAPALLGAASPAADGE